MTMIPAYAGGLLIIMQGLLMGVVGLHRAKSGVNLGLGDDPVLERKIRRGTHRGCFGHAGFVSRIGRFSALPPYVIRLAHS